MSAIIDTPRAVHSSSSVQHSVRDFAPYLDPCDYAEVVAVKTPEPTSTHYPLSHSKVVESVLSRLEHSSMKVNRQAHMLSHEGNRYWGVLELVPRSTQPTQQWLFDSPKEGGDSTLLMGIRNSHDKAYALGIISGTQVRVCSNGLFNSTINMRHKHTSSIMLELPTMIDKAIGDFSIAAKKQQAQIAAYKQFSLSSVQAHDLMVRAIDCDAISGSKLPQVIKAYNEPPHPEFAERTVWSLVNAFTEVYKSMSMENVVRRSQLLHTLMDTQVGLALAA